MHRVPSVTSKQLFSQIPWQVSQYYFFLSQHCPGVSWFLITRAGLFSWLPTFPFSSHIAFKEFFLMLHTLAQYIVQTATFAPLLFDTAFDVCSVTLQHGYWEQREPAIQVAPKAVAECSWQVLESLCILSCPLLPQSCLRRGCSSTSALGSRTCPCSCFLYYQIPYHCFIPPYLLALPDSVNPVLKNIPPQKPLATHTYT